MFVQLADSQLGLLNQNDDWRDESAMLELAVTKINKLEPKPSFVIVCGDLINEFPDGNAARAARQVADFKRILSAVKAPLLCVCGNHDVGNAPTPESLALFRSRFGADYFEFTVHGTKCLVLNSQLVESDLGQEQDDWLATVQPPRLIFSHIPPFIFEEDEPKGYFNHEPQARARLLAKLKKGQQTWFCGHFHRNAGGFTKDGKLEVVVTSAVGTTIGWNLDASPEERLGIPGMNWAGRACGPDASGLRCVCVHNDVVTHKWFTLADLPVSPFDES